MLLLHKACSKGTSNVKQKSQLKCDLIPVSQRQTLLNFWVLLLGVFICLCGSCLSPLAAYVASLAHTLLSNFVLRTNNQGDIGSVLTPHLQQHGRPSPSDDAVSLLHGRDLS